MHRTSSIAVALSVGLALAACTDLLVEEPKGFTTTDTFFKTGADLNSGTIAIYNSLRGLQGQGPWTTLVLASDESRAENREPNAGTYGPDRLDYDATTGLTGGFLATPYPLVTPADPGLPEGPGGETGNSPTPNYYLAQ